ncbi:MAG: ABC transporter substrate-binding protein [Candidatus Moraniibacteriota bacterium]
MINKLSQFIPKKSNQETVNQEQIGSDDPLFDPTLDKAGAGSEPQPKWRIPNWEQFVFLLKALSEKEKKIVLGALLFACIALAGWGTTMYIIDTDRRPALGGSYTEGVQGQPLYLNPVVAHSNPVDSDLSQLIFSSLFRYDFSGKLEQDLVSSWERSDDGTAYTVKLRSDVKWHDGKPLNAEDVLFTLNLIRNPNFSSTLRGNWEGIEVEKVDDFTLQFKLKKAYTPFLHNLTFGILPKHLWENVTSDKFLLTELNRKPVGSGMYSFIKLNKDKDGKIIDITLRANRDYYGSKPHIKELVFSFYDTSDKILDAYRSGEIKGIAHIETGKIKDIENESGLKIYDIPTTRIYGIFFNQKKSLILADKKNREALTFATDKEELLKVALENKGVVVNTPIIPNMLGYDSNLDRYEYNQEKAKSIFKDAGWENLNDKELKKLKEAGEGKNGIMYDSKTKKFLEITLTVPDYPELVKTADTLKKQWEKVGLRLNLDIVDTSETLQNKINDRNYEALLFGEVLQPDPDPTPFWHSSSKQAPGLNLSMFENQEVDRILDSARQEVNVDKRAEQYRRFQEIVSQEIPALFLFSPYYPYGVSDDYQGVGTKILYNPSNRLDDIGNRYLYTSRTRK